jgi:chromosome segregation ATPase
MQQRDKALQAIRELIKQKNDEILQVQSEITGVSNETRKEQEISEKLTDKLHKCKSEQDFLKMRKDEIENEKKRLNEQYIMLKNSLNSTESESQRMEVEKNNVDDKMQVLEKSIMQLHTKTKAIRDDILNHASQ